MSQKDEHNELFDDILQATDELQLLSLSKKADEYYNRTQDYYGTKNLQLAIMQISTTLSLYRMAELIKVLSDDIKMLSTVPSDAEFH